MVLIDSGSSEALSTGSYPLATVVALAGGSSATATPTSGSRTGRGSTSASSAGGARASSTRTPKPGSQHSAPSAVRTCKGPCGRTLPLTAEHFYVRGTSKVDGSTLYRGSCITCFNEGKKPSTPAQIEIARRYNREMQRLYRLDPVKAERMRELDRAYKQRAADQNRPVVNAKRRAQYSLRERAKRMAEGVEVRPAAAITRAYDQTRVDSEAFPPLPAGPLLVVIDEMVRRERAHMNAVALYVNPGERDSGCQGAVCERVGVIERRLNEWRRGLAHAESLIGPRLPGPKFVAVGHEPYPFVSFDLADRFLAMSGLVWWDVWSLSDVARNGRPVEWVFESMEVSHAC